MDWKRRERGPAGWPLLFLAMCFFAGILLGQVLAGRVPSEAGAELDAYLRDYVALEPELSAQAAFSTLVLYVRYPLMALVLGFVSAGAVLLPVLTAAFGFFLSFSVCCFTAAFGESGVLLALAVFGPRCAVTLPCYFLLAVPAWRTASSLAWASFGRGRRTKRTAPEPGWWRRAAVCGAALLAGMGIDLLYSPILLQKALERVLAR